MDRSRIGHRLAVVFVSVLTVGLVFSGRVSEALAQVDCLDGRSFEVTVTNCDGDVFPDVYCFADGSMTVEALKCESGPAKIKCKDSKAKFKATVRGVQFKGKVRDDMIEGTAVADSCESTFEGVEINNCPCPAPTASGAQGTNPYLP